MNTEQYEHIITVQWIDRRTENKVKDVEGFNDRPFQELYSTKNSLKLATWET